MATSVEEKGNLPSIVLMCLGNFFFWGAMYAYVPILSLYAQHLGASMSLVGIVVGAYASTQVLLRLPVGLLSDSRGRRKPFVVAGFAMGVVGCLGMAFSPNAWWLAFFRAVLGVGCAAWVPATVLFSSYFPPSRSTRAMGLISFAGTSAQLLVNPTGGKLAQELGWRAPFLVGAAMAALGTLCVAGLKDARVTRTGPSPLKGLRRSGVASRVLTVSLIGALLQYTTFTTVYAFTPIYSERLGASKTEVGLLMAAPLATYVLFSLWAATVAGWTGERWAAVLGLGIMSATTLAIPLVHTLALLAVLQLASGVGRGMVFPVLMSLAIKGSQRQDQATAMGIFQAIYALGMFAGPIIGGVVADAAGLTATFLSTGAVCLVGVGLAAVAIEEREGLGASVALASGESPANPDRK